jgi:opacity protein-like surface antigen
MQRLKVMQLKRVFFLALLGSMLGLPAQARADWFFTPYIGGNFGGDAPDTSVNFGGSLGYMGAGVIGFEFDFGYAPDFGGDIFDGDFEDDFDFTGEEKVTSLMANLIIGAPFGGQSGPGIRPYVSGGAGLLRRNLSFGDTFDDITENDFGINAGAGLMGFFSDNVGIRGDVRYFRGFSDVEEGADIDLELGDFDFWRGSVGIAFRF